MHVSVLHVILFEIVGLVPGFGAIEETGGGLWDSLWG
jgi:hypothetical protein